MKFSKFANKFVNQTGIGLLMDDLTEALHCGRDVAMLGGGNPSQIPDVQQIFRQRMQNLLSNPVHFDRALGIYDPPQGNPDFLEALASLFSRQCHWDIGPENIAITNGSQQAFFLLFNMFAGSMPDGSRNKILFPMSPEYIGYCDVGLADDLFISVQPTIEMLDDLFFKYHIDFDALAVSDDIGAICVSRPTNPTGNVLTDEEIRKLAAIARSHDIPLIIDNAYGKPFPDIIYTNVTPYWDPHTIMCMSLSKLGMPGTRSGIVIGPEAVIERIARINAVISLSPGGIGTALATDLVKTGEILSLGEEHILPYYRQKKDFAIQTARKYLAGLDVMIHNPEGAFFMWACFNNLPVPCHQLYERLKENGVIVVPGNYFFYGLEKSHRHENLCLRINYAQDAATVEKAFGIIAEQVRKLRT